MSTVTILSEVQPTTAVRYSREDRDYSAFLLVDSKEIYLGSRPTEALARSLAADELAKELKAQSVYVNGGTLYMDEESASSKAARAEECAIEAARLDAERAQRGARIRDAIAAKIAAKQRHVTTDELIAWLNDDDAASWLWQRAVDHTLLLIEQGETPRLLNRSFTVRFEQARQRAVNVARRIWKAGGDQRSKLLEQRIAVVGWLFDTEARERQKAA